MGDIQFKYIMSTMLSTLFLVCYTLGSVYILYRFKFKLDRNPLIMMAVCFLYFFISFFSWVFQVSCDMYCFKDEPTEEGYALVSTEFLSQIEFTIVIAFVYQVYTVYIFINSNSKSECDKQIK